MGNMTTLQILQGIKTWVTTKLNLKQDVINDLANIRSGAQAGSTAVQPAELSAYFNDASYDNNTNRINFYHGQTVVAYVDASPFIIDGMVDDVRIENGYLVIDFNTASGKQDISIPLTDIFNPNNYYNKTQTDGLLAQKQDVIQDLSDIRSGASAGSTAVQPSTLNNVAKNVVAESGVYDVSANNDNTKFESLSALLSSADLNTLIPTDIRKGGMSIKFVLSSDNKYVQYRFLLSGSFTTAQFANVANWIGDDNEIIIYNISTENLINGNPTEYATLKDALGTNGANVPSIKRYPGMSIKFIQTTLADYNVVKVTGLPEAPSGATLLSSASTVGNGVFKASQLSDFATLPVSIGNVAVYYIAVTETVDEQEVTTYTSWTITKISNDETKYVQHRYIATSTANADFVTLTNWQGIDDGITPNSIDLVKGKDVFNLLDSKNLNIGDVTGEYRFEGIFASKTYGTGYVKKLLGDIGVNPYEKIILKVVPADVNGATIKDGSIDLRTVAQSGSTYSFANVSLNQEYEFYAAGPGPKGFCIRITGGDVITEGYVTLICKRVIGSLYDYISRSSIVLARFQEEKVPSIVRTADLRFSITFQATNANVYSLNMQPYNFTLNEDTTFEVASYQGIYLNVYDGTLFKATINAMNTQSRAAILLFGVYNNTPFGVLANYYFSERARTFESDISDINGELSDLTDGIPSYFVDNVNQAIAKIKTNMATVGRNGESFIFISDMHWDTNVKNSHKLVRKILNSTNLIDVLSTGDLINESRDKSVMATALIDCVKAFSFNGHPLITTRGNHDDNSNWASQEDRDAYSFTFNEYYSYFMKQMEGFVTYLGTNDSFYYDKPETKTRYIFLDSARNGTVDGGSGAIQNSVNLLNATEAGWKVVFIQHFPTGAGMNAIKAMVDGCNNRSSAKAIPSYGITADFSNAQCECVAIFAGHTHADGSSTTGGGVPIVIIDTDCLGRKTASEKAEWIGTYNEQCFDVVTMDYVNRTIKCVRVGRGSDRTFAY